MAYINNHVERGLDRLLEQYKDRSKLRLFFTAFLSRYQLLENVLADIDQKTRLEHAQGKVLDRLGVNFGVVRNELSDDEYRREIFTRILINNSKGDVDGILTSIKLLYKPKHVYLREYDAFIQIDIQQSVHLQNIHQILPAVIAAGVKYLVVHKNDNSFIFSEASSETLDFTAKEETEIEIYVSIDDSLQIFEVEADALLSPRETLGFAEIIVTKTNLGLDDDNLYLVEEINPLEILLTYGDFIIEGGSKLAEVIQNG